MARQDAFPEHISLGDKYTPAMTITDPTEAEAYFEKCIEHHVRAFGGPRAEAETMERANLGYWAGYFDNGTRQRVERLFNCAHPYFGKIAEAGPPTPAEALAAGIERALAMAGRS